MIKIRKVNDSFIQIDGIDLGLAKTLSEYFSYFAENYKWHPKYKSGFWDGKIRLFNLHNRTLPIGLWRECVKLFKEMNIEFKVDKKLDSDTKHITKEYIQLFVSEVQKQTMELRDYQIESIEKIFKYQKAVCVSPTSSGKSFIISVVIDIIRNLNKQAKVLLVVPSISLIHQMKSDIVDYHVDKTIENDIKLIYELKHDFEKNLGSKIPEKSIVISTWQSLQTKSRAFPKKMFEEFDAILVDEAHGASATELDKIIRSSINAKFKLGFTGTLHKDETKNTMIKSLFGPIFKSISTKELIDKKFATQLKIDIHYLMYTNKKYRKLYTTEKDYRKEVDKLINHPDRLEYIGTIVKQLEGVSLVLFKNIKNGFSTRLFNTIREIIDKDIPIYYIDGSITGLEREKIRSEIMKLEEGIIVASIGTYSTGINIPNLKNVVFAEATKSQIKTLQSIGRVLRKSKNKDIAKLIDIADVLPTKSNYLMRHFKERLEMYKKEQFKFKIVQEIEFDRYFDGTE